jgi:hypothetical protein
MISALVGLIVGALVGYWFRDAMDQDLKDVKDVKR